MSMLIGSTMLMYAHARQPAEPIVLSDQLRVQPLESDVFLVVHHFGGGCNSLIVSCPPSDIVWVDTPCTDDATRQVHHWLTRTFTDPNTIQINTGFHNDNLGGNGYLIAQDIPCYGSDLTPKLIAKRWEQTRQMALPHYARAGEEVREAFLSQKLIAPNKLYPLAQGLTFRAGNESVEVFFPGPSHTADNVVVYFKSKRLLYGGCMIKALAARTPGFTGDADMVAWPVSVQKVLDRFPDTRLVVPGHGVPGDLALLPHTIRLFEQTQP